MLQKTQLALWGQINMNLNLITETCVGFVNSFYFSTVSTFMLKYDSATDD